VVTLAGSVDNDAQRDAAGRQAASVAGVKTVINNLQVGNVAATTAAAEMAEAGTPMSDHRASQAYRIAMLRNSLLKFYAETTEGARS